MGPPAGAEKRSPWVAFISGGLAGGIECTITVSNHLTCNFSQLRDTGGPKNPFSVVAKVIRDEGPRSLYTGCTALIIGTIGKDALRFVSFSTIKSSLADPNTGNMTPGRSLLAGALSGVVASLFAVTPTERIKTAMIDDAKNARNYKSATHAIKMLVQEGGPTALYAGLVSTTMKQASTTCVRLGSYDILKQVWAKYEVPQSTGMTFVNGSIAGTITVYTTQPFDVIKTRAQGVKSEGVIQAATGIMKDYGVKGYWRGSTMRLGRNVFSGAILFTAYEQIASVVEPLFVKTVQ